MRLGESLALLNACLNGGSAVCAVLAYASIRHKLVPRHRALMLTAVGLSTVFLASYVTRMTLFGDTKYTGPASLRIVYFVILVTHVLLAMTVVPLVLRTLYLAWRRRFDAHRRLARWTFPIWVYVSVTGVVVYLMLYQLRA